MFCTVIIFIKDITPVCSYKFYVTCNPLLSSVFTQVPQSVSIVLLVDIVISQLHTFVLCVQRQAETEKGFFDCYGDN